MTAPKPLDSAYLIVGNDRPKVRRALQRLRDRAVRESGSDLNVTSIDVEGGAQAPEALRALLEAAATPGLALGARVIIVTGAQHFRAAERKQIVAYLQDPTPDTVLAIAAEKLARDDALYKAVQKHGSVLAYDLPKKYEMAGWVRKMAEGKGFVLGQPAARHLLDLCGEDPAHAERLEREVDKLAAYCRGAEATVHDVDAVCVPDDEVRIYELTDAVGRRDRKKAFALLEAIYASGNPKEDANSVFYALRRHMGVLAQASGLGHTDQTTAAKQLGVAPFRAGKLLEQSQMFDPRRLRRACRALAVAETGLRGREPAKLESGSGVDNTDRLVVELALARLLS